MTDTTQSTITAIDLATAVATTSDEEQIERWVADLPKELVPLALWLAEGFEQRAKMYRRMATSRMVSEAILSSGEVWTSPEQTEYFWSGERHREVTDPEALLTALNELPLGELARRALKAAFVPQWKTYLTEIDKVAKFAADPKEAGQVVRSFVTWKESAPKLRPVEPER